MTDDKGAPLREEGDGRSPDGSGFRASHGAASRPHHSASIPNAPCLACPFSTSEIAEQAANLGCLPSASEALDFRRAYGVNWGCHNGGKCAGYIAAAKRDGIRYRGVPMASYDDWYHKGADVAAAIAMEARRAETENTCSVHDSAGRKASPNKGNDDE